MKVSTNCGATSYEGILGRLLLCRVWLERPLQRRTGRMLLVISWTICDFFNFVENFAGQQLKSRFENIRWKFAAEIAETVQKQNSFEYHGTCLSRDLAKLGFCQMSGTVVTGPSNVLRYYVSKNGNCPKKR